MPISVCHSCRSVKGDPLGACPSCGNTPTGDDQVTKSILLSDRCMPVDRLFAIALGMPANRRWPPPGVDLLSLKAVRPDQEGARAAHDRRKGGWVVAGILLLLLGLGFLYFSPWPLYRWAAYRDSVDSYREFVAWHPESSYVPLANDRIRILREPEVWAAARASGVASPLQSYLRDYPDGSHLEEARSLLREQSEARWRLLSTSRSEPELRAFMGAHPESERVSDAEARIMALHDDWTWVREQDSLDHYQRFLERFPNHDQRSWIERRIIDLEVAEIAAGEHGVLPRAEPLRLGGASASVEVENGTGYELTVRYSGPSSLKLVIPVDATRFASLAPGSYQVAASVDAFNVRNYYGTDSMAGGQYSSRFYIEGSGARSPSPGIPRRRR